MNKLFAGTLAITLAFLLTANLVAADVATGTVGTGAGPGDEKPKICVNCRYVFVNGINVLQYRTGMYAFTGEQIFFKILVRDPNGALDIGFPRIKVDNRPEVLCNEIPLDGPCDGLGDPDSLTDKAFECLLTVEPSWYGDSVVKITVYNSNFQPTDGTHTENWFFNPAIRLDVSTSDGQSIHFEDGKPGDIVHSENKIIVKNIAEGGVNLWTYIAGTDMYDPSGDSKCPTTNKIDIETYMWFRGWTGTISGEWIQMSEYDQNKPCFLFDGCYGARPIPAIAPLGNVLTNMGTMESEFKLKYPVPCVGTFSQGSIFIFGKAI
jgi:hypothetical protein